jgi:hypothetical protein
VADGQADSHSGVEENVGQIGMLQKGSMPAINDQNQPKAEFQHGSLDTLMKSVNVARPSEWWHIKEW